MLTEKELSDFSWQREQPIKTIKDCVPAAETRDDLGRVAARPEELESVVNGTAEEAGAAASEYGRLLPAADQRISRSAQ